MEERTEMYLSDRKGSTCPLEDDLCGVVPCLAILLYILSFFQVLKGPSQSMNYFRATCNRFAKWSVICRPKDQSGLGIHDFEAKNTALHNGHLNFLPKMGWEPETGRSLVLIYWFISPLAGPLESLFGWANEGKPILLQIYNLNL
jgi:hypothetical protein